MTRVPVQETQEAGLIRVAPETIERADELREKFLHAEPFRYVFIDEFFENGFAETLLAEFPSFDRRLAIAESGTVGGKAVNTTIATISPGYKKLYELISSNPFLEFLSRLSGVPDLIPDPAMYGGGTHENLHGQELDPHVDFNLDQTEQLHRRLNLIVYLNKEWRAEWGGGLEIHSNPRRPEENRIRTCEPLFNRAVLFETNEYSWHGFPKIDLPEDKRHLSRKSISIYLYTKDRPAGEVAPKHATFYVQRPLPPRFAPGHILSPGDILELQRLLVRRDRWIELYQQMELDHNRKIGELHRHVLSLEDAGTRAPLTGYVLQQGCSSGLYADMWASSSLRVRIAPQEPVMELTLKGYRPESSAKGTAKILIDGKERGRTEAGGGPFEVVASLLGAQTEPFDVEVLFDKPAAKTAQDDRDLAFVLIELRARHPR
jgi:2OG-Fe(II) oxygenase superfamily